MFQAVLFDLDGTLLDIDMQFFLEKYFEEMGRMAAAYGFNDVKGLLNQVLRSTGAMIRRIHPQSSNEKTFMEDFFAEMNLDREKMVDFWNEFYRSGFPTLRRYCSPFVGIPEMMARVFEQDCQVVIATNAVFPAVAIQARIDWAGVGRFPYSLVTSYENMHFCKPQPQYYQEILDKIGVQGKECLMVGNDTLEDLVASELGIKTFLVEDRLIDRGDSPYRPDWRGRLKQFFAFVENLK